jgi:hypothetical protein
VIKSVEHICSGKTDRLPPAKSLLTLTLLIGGIRRAVSKLRNCCKPGRRSSLISITKQHASLAWAIEYPHFAISESARPLIRPHRGILISWGKRDPRTANPLLFIAIFSPNSSSSSSSSFFYLNAASIPPFQYPRALDGKYFSLSALLIASRERLELLSLKGRKGGKTKQDGLPRTYHTGRISRGLSIPLPSQ